MLKSNFRRIILFAIAVTLSSLMAVFALPQREGSKQPIHKEGVINALKQLHRGDSQAEIVGQIRLRGVDFELTPAIEKELRGAGASSEMIEAIRANYRPPVLPKTAANEISFWNSIKDSANPDDYRAYLKKYPDGQFAQAAQNQVNSLQAAATESASWNSIKDSTNPDDYRNYLAKYPNGKFAELARNRTNSLETARIEEARKKEENRKEAKRKEDAAKRRPGEVVKNSIGMQLVYVPPGSFDMGSNNGYEQEKPVHRVTIGQGFFIGKYEVTQGQWQAVMGSNRSYFKGDENLPVERVSWHDAQEFINKLNEMNDAYNYRLPTEAEWEYACRAGTTGDYYAPRVDDIGWWVKNSGQKTHRVGSKQPNAFGLYDMSGNVFEWCLDWQHSDYAGAPTDGSAWVSAGGEARVVRGGSWFTYASRNRSASRLSSFPDSRDDGGGFRLVAVVRTQ